MNRLTKMFHKKDTKYETYKNIINNSQIETEKNVSQKRYTK